MSLGYALLHPRQLDAALVLGPEKHVMDTMMDVFCGALGIEDVDEELAAAFAAQFEDIEGFVARFETLFEPGRPLAQLKIFGEIDVSDPAALAAALDRLCAFLESANPDQIRAFALPVIDGVLEVLPNLETEVVASFVSQRLDGLIDILKAPLRKGRKDVAAIKAYRAAMTLRCLLDPVHVRLNALGRVDLKVVLHEIMLGMLDGIGQVDFGPLREAIATLKGQFGGLLKALFDCAAGGSVSAGAQTMPDPPLTILNEVQAIPHTLQSSPGIWAIDLTTNILNLFNYIWEIVRTRPFVDRGADGAFLIIGVIWQTVRTVLRAAIPDKLNRPVFEADSGQKFVNWLFSDWGDTAIHLFLRWLSTTIYESTDDKTNWALMLASRWLVYISNSVNFRIWYQFARSIWYLDAHKKFEQALDDVADRDAFLARVIQELLGDLAGEGALDQDRKLNKMPLGRMLMAVIPLVWLVSGVIAATPALPWDNFEVENWGGREYGIIFAIPPAIWIASHFWMSELAGLGVYESITFAALPDVPLFATVVAGMFLMTLALGFVVGGIESDSQGAALAGVIVFPTVLFALLLTMGAFWIWGDRTLTGRSGVQAAFTQTFSLLATLVMGLIASITWWFICDDGRDREGDYDDLDVSRTPYKLPVRAGENWFCGQSFHGIFSHLLSSTTSHYAVDMNEAPGKSGMAARSGFVISVTQGNPDDESTQNDVTLMHSDWAENADPGEEDERVLTYSNFVHTKEYGVRARVGQFVPRGMHLTDIDSTGRSAQHHTHYSGQTAQKGDGREGLPFLFGDTSLREFRNYPFLSIFPTMGQIEGKPLSFAFYVSDNEEAAPHPHALTLTTRSADVTVGGATVPHSHRIFVTNDLLTGGDIPASVTLNTTVDAGHFHTVTLTREQFLNAFRMDTPAGAITSSVAGHSHSLGPPLIYEFFLYTTTDDTAGVNGTDREHSHSMAFGLDYLSRYTIPPGGFTYRLWQSWSHQHDVTLTTDQIRAIMRPERLDLRTTGVTAIATPSDVIGPHTHGSTRSLGLAAGSRNMAVTIVEPPAGQLTARRPAPYDLLGENMVVRVNDRATEWHFWAGERSRAVADIAIDHGLAPGEQIEVGGTTVAMPAGSAPATSVRDTVLALSSELRRPPALTPPESRSYGPPARRAVVRSDPVIVVETRARGAGARLELTGGSLPTSLLPAGSAAVATGTGPFNELTSVSLADLQAHITDLIQNGWAAPPSPVATTIDVNGRLTVTVGGAPAVFSGSSSRAEQVLGPLVNTGNGRLRATGAIPVGTGRMALAPGYTIPLLATPATVTIPAPGAGSTLQVTVNGARTVPVSATADAAQTARRIMQQVEGIRARSVGGNLVLETLAAGPGARLEVAVDAAAPVLATGSRPAGFAYADLTRLPVLDLQAVIDEAVARDPVLPHAVAHNLRVEADANRLRIAVDAPATVAATVVTTGGADPISFVAPQASDQEVVSQNIAGNLRFEGPAWVDIAVTEGTTQTLRIPIDGEPARLDILPDRLPDNGETLTFDVGGAAVNVTFDGSGRSVQDVIETIGAASDEIYVRLAQRVTVEDMLWGDQGGNLDLIDTRSPVDGLALTGFLGARNFVATERLARGEDMLAQGGIFPAPENRSGQIVETENRFGQLVDVVNFSRIGSGAGSRMRLTAVGPAAEVVVNVRPGNDPLGFAVGATPDILETPPLPDAVDLEGMAKLYHFTARAPDGSDVAHGFMQLAAQPAIARAIREPSLPLAGATVLEIGITEPPVTRRLVQVELSGATTLDEIALRINAASPQIRAWVARVSEVHNFESARATWGGVDVRTFGERLHIETAGGGSDWRLDLGNVQVAAALGFPLSAEDGGRLVLAGRGDVRNGRAATREEIARAIERAVESMTGSDNPVGNQDRMSATMNGDTIELRSAEGQLDLVFEPPELAQRIVTDVQPKVTRLNASPVGGGVPPATLPLDSGRILVRAGGRGLAAVELFAAPAQLVSDVPIPATAVNDQIDALKNSGLRLRINGILRFLPPVPASVTTLEEAIAFINRATAPGAGWNGDDWWIGLRDVPGVPGARQVVIQTMRRGTSAQLELLLSAFTIPWPTNGILGFTNVSTMATGAGNVLDMDAVNVAPTLLDLVEDAARRGGARQSIYTALSDATGLRVQGSLTSTTLVQTVLPVPAPGGVTLSDPLGSGGAARLLTHAYSGVRALEPGVLEILSNDAALPNPRPVRALVHAEPARLGPFLLPTSLQSLNGTRLALTEDGTDFDIALTADATTTNLDIARQIEQGADWGVRVIAPAGATEMTVETLRRGTAAELSLRTPATGTDAVTDDPGTGFTRPGTTTVRGTGSVENIAAVSAADYATVLQNGMIADRRQADQSLRNGFLRVEGSAYDPSQTDLTDATIPVRPLPREFARIASQRTGCSSSLVPMTFRGAPALPEVFNMDRTLENAPAVRAAVRIPPFGERTLSGRLHVQFNENNGISDLPLEQTVVIDVPNRSYEAPRLAALLHGRLFDAGVGSARAYGDGSIMIETLASGIAGTVRIPAATTPATERTLAEILIPGGAFARGWPGAGRTGPGQTRLPGFRSAVGNMMSAAGWEFTNGAAPTVPTPGGAATRNDLRVVYTGASGDSIPATASSLDSALATITDPASATGATRIGLAAVGDDGALYVEGLTNGFDLISGVETFDSDDDRINDAARFSIAVPVDKPSRIGGTFERQLEPAANLRRTHEVRTVRIMRDKNGHGVLTEHDDLGWVRNPADEDTGVPVRIAEMPPGRYLSLARVDAAKTRNYDAASEMVALSAAHQEDPDIPVILQARYWLAWQDSAVMGVVFGPDGEIMVRLERQLR